MTGASNGNSSKADISATATDLTSMTNADANTLADYYDKWAQSYDADLPKMGYDAPKRAAEIMREQGVAFDAPILDAGCGTGLTGLELAKAGYTDITGIDLSLESLQTAEDKEVYRHLKKRDMNKTLAFGDNGFAAVQCIGTLTYVRETRQLFSEFCRVVKPGGIVCFTQRTDLYDDAFIKAIQATTRAKKWDLISHSDPMPYLPNHEDFGDRKHIFYDVFRVK
ncbi:class I SAM-dependent DNA methyltransferase [Thalassospira australica]|uniref:class I SAM-dependent DNA methyltransferase n=1 Tax=Thalassospira australica TaxID=1528106 RepID=UPI00051A749F|nr:class I SAM-dependent methyltransferase [Thalassospira australica]